MPGRRYAKNDEEQNIELEIRAQKVQEKKERIIDTLLIITGFLFATSYSSMSSLYLIMVMVFLACCIFIKTTSLIGLQNKSKLPLLIYLLISFLFPWILISVYFTKEPMPTDLDPVWIIPSLVAVALIVSFTINPEKDNKTKYDQLIFLIYTLITPILALCALILVVIFILSLISLGTVFINTSLSEQVNIIGALLSLFGIAITFGIFYELLSNTIYDLKRSKNNSTNILHSISKIDENTLEFIFISLLIIEFCLLFIWWNLILIKLFPDIVIQDNSSECIIQNLNITIDNASYIFENISTT